MSSRNGARALVVDDEADNRELLASVLRREGYVVEEAADGIEALDRLTEGPLPAIVLVDLMMPRMDGHELLSAIAASPRLSVVPTVVVSACGPVALARARASARMEKPIDLEVLLGIVNDLVDASPSAGPRPAVDTADAG